MGHAENSRKFNSWIVKEAQRLTGNLELLSRHGYRLPDKERGLIAGYAQRLLELCGEGGLRPASVEDWAASGALIPSSTGPPSNSGGH